ncbi:FHA domain-containing protein [bacterium]|nr:FHA domain-containing protein [candidate division CSSED10-310 bacterium]
MARLTVFVNEKPGRIYRLDSKIRIGRYSANEIQILDQKVSRHHISIERVRGFFILKDLGSRNGTYLNDVRITESELRTGDRIHLGNTNLLFADEPQDDVEALLETKNDGVLPGEDTSIELIYSYRTLKDQINRTTELNEKFNLMERMTRLITFASNCHPLESGPLLMQEIQEILHTSFVIDRSYVVMRDPKDGVFHTEAVRSIQESIPPPDFNQPVFHRVIMEGLSILSTSGFNTLLENESPSQSSGFLNAMSAPIRHGSQIIGLLYVDSSALMSRFCENDLAFLSAIGNIAGANLHSWILHNETKIRYVSSWFALSRLTCSPFSDRIETRSERIIRQSFKLCETMGLPDDQTEIITMAVAIAFHMAMSDDGADHPELRQQRRVDADRNSEYAHLDWIGTLPGMTDVVRLLRYRFENFDGSGSGKLAGNAIPLGSRILRTLLMLAAVRDNCTNIADTIKDVTGTILDPMIVRIVLQIIQEPSGSLFANAPANVDHQDTDPISGTEPQEKNL